MTHIRKAYADDFEAIYPLFLTFREPRPSKETFRQLFVHRWPGQEEHFGYILEDGSRAVGFLGALTSEREINGRPEKFCNMCCWVVAPEYRSQSLSLVFHLLKLENVTITNFTGVKVIPILKPFGFRVLDAYSHILLPLPRPAALGCRCRVRSDPGEIESRLDAHDRQIFADHRELHYPFVLVDGGDEYSLLSVKTVRRKRLPVAEVHYLSHRKTFLRHVPHLLPALCLRLGVFGLMVGEHFLDGETHRPALIIPQRLARLYRSTSVGREEMDTLYSELQVLNL
ncbi:MAG: hypothetical protein JXB85_11890 [Anaerolineales bacterium]|nr:hypothetical protein [Anaerolineales bacterium]